MRGLEREGVGREGGREAREGGTEGRRERRKAEKWRGEG